MTIVDNERRNEYRELLIHAEALFEVRDQLMAHVVRLEAHVVQQPDGAEIVAELRRLAAFDPVTIDVLDDVAATLREAGKAA